MKSANTSTQASVHWPSAWQFALSLLAILGLWGSAMILAIVGFGQLVSAVGSPEGALATFMMAVATLTAGVLLIPSAGYALSRLMGWRGTLPLRALNRLNPNLLILAFPLVLLLGYLAGGAPGVSWLILPPLHVLAVGLPVLWLLYLTVHRLPIGSPQRGWGAFGSGLVLAPLLILILEGLALLFVGLLAVISIANQPELIEDLTSLAQWMSVANPPQDELLEALAPYLLRPAVIGSALTFAAVLVPLIEELFKPIGVWLLVGRKLSPAAGFALGALSGAGYAMFESMSISMGLESWPQLVVLRIGTAVIHILTSGIVGWALSLAWFRGRYIRLGLVFLGAVGVHGLWNGLTLTTTFAGLAMQLQEVPSGTNILFSLQVASVIGLGLLVVGAFITILRANKKFSDLGQQKLRSGPTPDDFMRDQPYTSAQNQAGVLLSRQENEN